jgi:multiple sugar transport system substrate-binding protein
MRKIKKAALILLSFCMLFMCMGGFAGCGKKKDLKVFIFAQSHEVETYKEITARFEQEQGITVELSIQEDGYFDLLNTDLINGTAADVFYVRPGDVRAHAKEGTVINLSAAGHITEAEAAPVWKKAIDFYRFDGTNNNAGDIWALPKDYSQYVLGFNKKKIQDNAGVMERLEPYLYDPAKHGAWETWQGAELYVKLKESDANDPDKRHMVKLPGLPGEKDADGNDIVYTYDEFGALSYLCANTGQHSDVVKVTYGTAFWESMCLMAYVWGSGGEFLKDNYTKVNFQDPKFVEGYEGFLSLIRKWNAGSTASSKTGYEMFTEGSLVFYPVGTWDIGYFNQYSSVLDYELMPWPISDAYANTSMADRQDKWMARVDSVGYGVYSGSKNVETAVKYIKYLSINEDIQRYLASTGIQIPNIESVALGDYVNNEIKNQSGGVLEPKNKRLLLNVASGVNGHFGPTVYTYNEAWFNEFLTGAQAKLWEGDVSVADYCAEYGAKAQTKLDEAIALENSLG